MRLITLSAVLFCGLVVTSAQAMSIGKEYAETTVSCAEQMLNNQPVLVKDKDNSIGVIVENVNNFPKLPNNDVYEDTDATKTSRDKLLTMSSTEKSMQSTIINLDGNPTRVVLADFQQRLINILRSGGKNPSAIFEKNTQTVVTPDDSEALVDINIAVWKIK